MSEQYKAKRWALIENHIAQLRNEVDVNLRTARNNPEKPDVAALLNQWAKDKMKLADDLDLVLTLVKGEQTYDQWRDECSATIQPDIIHS